MKFDERFLDELKSRLRLSDVIGRSVVLKRQGREYRGLSPFTKERTPSFYVNDEKGFYHDFSSGKHGDLIGFLQETERLSFREAVEKLAEEAGLQLPAEDPRARAQEQRRLGLQDWLEEAARWFEAQLGRPQGEAARAYLDRRALPREEWPRFRLGYAPSGRNGLKDHLIAKGAHAGDLIEAGLLVAPEDNTAPFDRFRDRIIFPITDARGRVVSFGGRALDPNARAKYLNGPESPLFHKGATLYGLAEARKLLHLADSGGSGERAAAAGLVVVEGYMDAIACQRADIAAVAPLGTALTESQIELLWRSHPEPTLCFDGDAAGLRAAYRSLDRALPLLQPSRSLRFAFPSGGKDPDEILRDQGPAGLRAQLIQTKPFVQVLFEREQQAEPLSTPESYAGLKARLRKVAATIADRDLGQMYKEALLDQFEQLRQLARPSATVSGAGRALAEYRWQGKKGRQAPPGRASPQGREGAKQLHSTPDILAAGIAQAVLEHPELLDDVVGRLETRGFDDERLDALAHELVRERLSSDILDSASLRDHLAARGFGETLQTIARAASRLDAPFLKPGTPFEEVRAVWSQAFDTLIRITALERAVADAKVDAERDGDFSALFRLKSERDAERRAVRDGTAWTSTGTTPGVIIH